MNAPLPPLTTVTLSGEDALKWSNSTKAKPTKPINLEHVLLRDVESAINDALKSEAGKPISHIFSNWAKSYPDIYELAKPELEKDLNDYARYKALLAAAGNHVVLGRLPEISQMQRESLCTGLSSIINHRHGYSDSIPGHTAERYGTGLNSTEAEAFMAQLDANLEKALAPLVAAQKSQRSGNVL